LVWPFDPCAGASSQYNGVFHLRDARVAPCAPSWCKPLEMHQWRGMMRDAGSDFHKLFHSFCEDRVTL